MIINNLKPPYLPSLHLIINFRFPIINSYQGARQMDYLNKHCPKCGEEKSRNEFYNNKRRNDGKDSICKECRKEINKTNYMGKKT